MDDERFCTRCGENVGDIPPVGDAGAAPAAPVYNNNGYTQNHAQSGVPGNAPYTYAQPAAMQEEMTVGKWLLTIIITTFFNLISIIALFIWAFGDGPESRKNYCKAMLIIKLITVILSIILMVIWIGIVAAYSDDIIRFLEDNYPEIENGFEQFAETAMMHIPHLW